MVINNLSYSAQYVFLRAGSEAVKIHRGRPGIEYWFLGILKLSRVVAKDTFKLTDADIESVDADVTAVKEALSEHGINIDLLRQTIRHALSNGAISDPCLIDEYIMLALNAANHRGETKVWAIDLLKVLLEKPTDTLKECLEEKSPPWG